MKVLMLTAALAAGLALTGCVADNAYVDSAEEQGYQKARTSWLGDRPVFGAAYNEPVNDKEIR